MKILDTIRSIVTNIFGSNRYPNMAIFGGIEKYSVVCHFITVAIMNDIHLFSVPILILVLAFLTTNYPFQARNTKCLVEKFNAFFSRGLVFLLF